MEFYDGSPARTATWIPLRCGQPVSVCHSKATNELSRERCMKKWEKELSASESERETKRKRKRERERESESAIEHRHQAEHNNTNEHLRSYTKMATHSKRKALTAIESNTRVVQRIHLEIQSRKTSAMRSACECAR